MTSGINPDEIIEDLGGCGPYQIRMSIIVHVVKTVIGFSIITMVVALKTPPIWYCVDDIDPTFNVTLNNNNSELLLKSCTTVNGSVCSKFRFEKMGTIVSSFDLVCDNTYVPATIMSIQTAGMLFGNMASGQLADLFGRKRPFFSSFVILIISNIVGFASINWYMLAVSRFFVGLGAGFFLSIQYSLMSEFTLSKWRAWIKGFPSWPIQGCLFALLGWLIQDWRYIMLMCSLMGVPCLLAWCGYRHELTNAVAIIANTGIATAWGPVQTMTIELYPTVIRSIGFGSLSVIARFGAILGPQLVLMSVYIPGILYFVCGVLATLCICGLFGLPETMNANLSDKIQQSEKKQKGDIKHIKEDQQRFLAKV